MQNETELLDHIDRARWKVSTGLDREAALADMRFNFIERALRQNRCAPAARAVSTSAAWPLTAS